MSLSRHSAKVKMHLVTLKKCFVKGGESDFKGKTQHTSLLTTQPNFKAACAFFTKKNARLL